MYYNRPQILALITMIIVISTGISLLSNVPTASAAGCSWWNASWTRRRKITFDNSAQAENLVNFPALLVFDATNIDYAQTQAQGQDLRFIDDDCTTLVNYEIEKWNEAGTSYVWVNVPQIDASSSTDFVWLYYGNSGASAGQNATATWNNSYESVWHLHNDFLDSTSGNHDGSNNGSTDATGVVADGQSFDGNDWIDTNYSSNYGSGVNLTWEGWFNVGSIGGSDDIMGIEDRALGDKSEIRMAVREGLTGSNPVDQVDIWIRPDSGTAYGDSTATSPTSNQWHHIAIVRDGSTGRVYIDGSQLSSGVVSTGALNFPVTLLIGAQWETDVGGSAKRNWFLGKLDELRISTTNRSAAWLAATYKTVNQNGTFTDYGTEEQFSPTPTPTATPTNTPTATPTNTPTPTATPSSSVTTTSITFPNTTLNGTDQTLYDNSANNWQVTSTNPAGTSWNVNISSTDFSTGTYTIDVSNFATRLLDSNITPGSDKPASQITTYTPLSTSDQQLLAYSGLNGNSTFDFIPDFRLDILAETYIGNYSGTVTATYISGP